MRTRPRLLSVLAATIALYGRADAGVLGDVLTQSALGEPLRVELRLMGESDARRAAECLRIAPPADSADALPWLAKGGVAAHGNRIVVASPSPVFDPVLRFALEDTCSSRLRREYTLLLSYPEAPGTPAAQTSAPESSATAPQRRAARPAAAPVADGRTWTTAPGESVEALARALFPKDSETRRHFVAATLKANPELPRDATAELPAGTELHIPDLTRLAAAPRRRVASAAPMPAAPREVRPAQPAEARTKTPPAPSHPEEPAPVADRLFLAGSDEASGLRLSTELGSIHRTALTTDSERALLRREQQLIIALDRITESQLALGDRIRRLEEIESALTERAIQVGAIAAPPAPEAELAPASVPAPATAANGAWIYTTALFASISLALAMALLRLRHPRREDVFSDLLPMPAQGEVVNGEAAAGSAIEGAFDATDAQGASTAQTSQSATGFTGVGYERAGYDNAAEARERSPLAAAAPVDWNAGEDFFSRPPAVAPLIVEEEHAEEHDSAIELAEIMVSFGRVQGAAETLAEFIRGNPKQAVTPWLKLLEVYRMAGLRPEFDALARQLNKTFNVKTVTWENFDVARSTSESIEQMPHIIATLEKTWRTRECQGYLQKLLRDNRDGTRQGFPLSVIDEILMLSAVLEQELGPYRPEQPPPPAGEAVESERQAA